ncbi:hypothetical protein BaRGS_00012801 [Batillaria attramentaria]|uniref:Uncharacterized protein n=1 Tax=Batillaria attramentaria TaxID=370345 RepID=A0ABD0L9S6_9CAEN
MGCVRTHWLFGVEGGKRMSASNGGTLSQYKLIFTGQATKSWSMFSLRNTAHTRCFVSPRSDFHRLSACPPSRVQQIDSSIYLQQPAGASGWVWLH